MPAAIGHITATGKADEPRNGTLAAVQNGRRPVGRLGPAMEDGENMLRVRRRVGVAFLTFLSYGAPMQTVSVKLPEDLLGRLDELVRQTGEDRSALIRQSVGLLVANKQSGSAHQKLAHLCGTFKGGAKDASVSEDYQERFGRD
jgi:Arc/MetJ-type ribon-helix-helix transcriptional regulator